MISSICTCTHIWYEYGWIVLRPLIYSCRCRVTGTSNSTSGIFSYKLFTIRDMYMCYIYVLPLELHTASKNTMDMDEKCFTVITFNYVKNSIVSAIGLYYTICPRSNVYIVSYYIKRVTTSGTLSNKYLLIAP
mgnify:CR=1 FL=1